MTIAAASPAPCGGTTQSTAKLLELGKGGRLAIDYSRRRKLLANLAGERNAALDVPAHAHRFLRMLAAGGFPEPSEIDPCAMRAAFLRLAQVVDAKEVPVGSIENSNIPGPLGPLAIRVYSPVGSGTGQLPGLLYSKVALGCSAVSTPTMASAAFSPTRAVAGVASVAYRPAPEHKLPAAIEDSYAAAT